MTAVALKRPGADMAGLGWVFVWVACLTGCTRIFSAAPDPAATLAEASPPPLPTTSPTLLAPTQTLTPSPWPTVTPFANQISYEIIGQIGGPASAVAVKSGVAYLGIGPQVLILDVSDPAVPRQIGQSGSFPDAVRDIALVDELVYVSASRGGLRIMDLAQPLEPRQVGFVPSQGSFGQVIVREKMAFVAETLGEYPDLQEVVRLFDVSVPASPRELGRLDGLLLDVQGSQVYVIQDKTLRVMDISTSPTDPQAIDTGLHNASAIAGQYVYTIDAISNTLGIVDLSDPGIPRPRGSLKFEGEFSRGLQGVIKVNEDLVYLKSTFGGESGAYFSVLFLVDVSDPDSPRQIGSWFGKDDLPASQGMTAIPGSFAGEAINDSFLYLALKCFYTDNNGLWIVNVREAANPHKVGNFSVLSNVFNVVSIGKFAYVLQLVGVQYVLNLIDLSNWANIHDQGTVISDGIGALEDVTLIGHYLYAPGFRSYVMDLADPVHPLDLDLADAGLGGFSEIEVAGHQACASYIEGGLGLFDITNPARPREIGHLDTESIYHLACAETGAFYITTDYQRDFTTLHIADTSELDQPREVASQNLPMDFISDIAYHAGFLYVTGSLGAGFAYHEQLLVFDVSDKTHPRQVNALETDLYRSNIAVHDHYAYLGGPDILVFDLSDPARPRPVGRIEIPGGALHIGFLEQGTVLIAGGSGGGLILLRIDGLR